ncbi:MAG: energy-coupling factor ABC transporter permease [Nitrospirota bacterium]
MTHMHIPDGILPVWLWVLGFVLMLAAIGFCLTRLGSTNQLKKIPLLGGLSAVMLVAMSLEILPLAYHINLSVAAGILLGPVLGFFAACITNLILALMGHGGITVIGLNALLLGSEAVLGHALFSFLKRVRSVFLRSILATIGTLIFSTIILIMIVAVSQSSPELFLPEHEHTSKQPSQDGTVNLLRFTVLVVSLGSLGWILEATITGFVIRFISRVKPEMLNHVLHRGQDTSRGLP